MTTRPAVSRPLWRWVAVAVCSLVTVSLAAEQASVPQVSTTADRPVVTAATVAATTRIVQPGDTLMALSREWFETLSAASESVTLSQVLIGIHRANPQAFGRDMNELLIGTTVQLPDAATLRLTPRRAALEEVRTTLGIWLPDAAAAPSPSRGVASEPAVASAPGLAETPARVETLEERLARIEAELAVKQRQLDTLAAQQAIAASEAKRRNDDRLLSSDGLFAVVALAIFGFLLLFGVMLLRARRRRAIFFDEPEPSELSLLAPAPASSDPPTPAVISPSSSRTPDASSDDSRIIGRRLLGAEPTLEGDAPPVIDPGSLIDLAEAYIEMGQGDAARVELQRVLEIGDDAQRAEARRLLERLPNA